MSHDNEIEKHEAMHTGMTSPKGNWWKPAHKSEKTWVVIAFAWCMVLFAMMPLWHWKGGQNPSGIRRSVEPGAFMARTQEFIQQYKVGEDRGMVQDGGAGRAGAAETVLDGLAAQCGRADRWDYRDFFDPETVFPGGEFHFDLKSIPYKFNLIKIYLFQNFSFIANKTCRCIMNFHSGNKFYIYRSEVRH